MGQDVSVVVGAAEGMGLAVSERLACSHPAGWCSPTSRATRSPGSPSDCAARARTRRGDHGPDRPGYLAAQTFAKRMIDTGVKGSIVAVTSVSARPPQPDMAAYVASKAAVTAALRVLGM